MLVIACISSSSSLTYTSYPIIIAIACISSSSSLSYIFYPIIIVIACTSSSSSSLSYISYPIIIVIACISSSSSSSLSYISYPIIIVIAYISSSSLSYISYPIIIVIACISSSSSLSSISSPAVARFRKEWGRMRGPQSTIAAGIHSRDKTVGRDTDSVQRPDVHLFLSSYLAAVASTPAQGSLSPPSRNPAIADATLQHLCSDPLCHT